MSKSRWLTLAVCLVLLFSGACAPSDESEPEPSPPPPAVEPVATVPSIHFVEPADGATVPTLFKAVFGAENFTIEPVDEGMIHEGAGHFHIGLDTECLAAGEVIPTADPWIHFGDGSDQIELEMALGEHTLTIQIGDGEHRTLEDEGLCNTISITVSEDAATDDAEDATE